MKLDQCYYQVAGLKTNSKNRALLLANGDRNKIHFYQHDQFWDQQDWKIDPVPSFDQLCHERCRQLRDKYEWLCLWLSSGYDSQTVLQSFIDSNIQIDEIAYMYRLDYYNDPEIPYIEYSIENYKKYFNPNLKITKTIIDFKYTIDFYKKNKEDWLFHKGQNVRTSKSTASLVHDHCEQILRIKDTTPKNRADIYGKEKPRMDLRDGWWFVQSIDFMWDVEMDSPIESFYISDQMPELHIKQCHMVANWFESLAGIDHDMVHRIQSHDAAYYKDWNLACGRKEVMCPHSRDAINKSYFKQCPDNHEGQKLYNYLKSHEKEIYNQITQQQKDLKKILNTDNLSKPIFGKAWPLRPFSKPC